MNDQCLVRPGVPPRAHWSRSAPRWKRSSARVSPSPFAAARRLSFQAIHGVTGRDDRSARARAVMGVAFLHAVGTEERDAEIAVHVRSDDGLVVAGDGPCERLLVIC